MKRRDFITSIGGAAAWPLGAWAQRQTMPVIGFLHGGSPEPNSKFVTAFRKGLSETAYVEGQNVTIEFRWAVGRLDRLPEMAIDLIRRRVAVIATPLSTEAAFAAKTATTTIPIIFGSGGDPVALGLVNSINRPGGNVTGVTLMNSEISSKRIGLLHELVPAAKHIAVLGNPDSSLSEATIKDLKASAQTVGLQVIVFYARTDREIDEAFANLVQTRPDALVIAPNELFTSHNAKLATLTVQNAVPAVYGIREFVVAGGFDELRLKLSGSLPPKSESMPD